jgi:hypothetical protein
LNYIEYNIWEKIFIYKYQLFEESQKNLIK